MLDIDVEEETDVLILRMRSVSAIDATAMGSLDALLDTCKKRNVRLVLSHIAPQPLKAMKKSGFYDAVGEENFCDSIENAIAHAKAIAE